MEPQILETLILILHVLAGLAIIGLVLIQHGKGADAGSGFGGGSASTVFGSSGAGNFLTKMTTSLAIAFFITSFALAYFAKEKSVAMRDLGVPQVIEQDISDYPADVLSVEVPQINEARSNSEVPATLPNEAEIPE
ncbi:MAG: preprotein translocase subunit SecG [Pseudomonadales bacterium]|nr:preprotein translocase subunit SecG [Pseudomonadales bacterium]